MSNSTCLRANLENSNIGSVNKSQAPSKKKPDGGLNEVAFSQPKATQKHHPFRASGHTPKHEGTNMTCKPNCAPGGTLSKSSGGILAGSTGEHWRAAPARYWPDTRQDPPARDTQRNTWRDPLASYSGIISGLLGGIHWRAVLVEYSAGSSYSTQRDPLASYPLAGCSGGIHWRATLAGYLAGSTGELLWDTQRDTRRHPLAGPEKCPRTHNS